MIPKELPDECPECGDSSGWYIDKDPSLFVASDGTVRLGRDNNRRYGYKFEALCNDPECDAAVNLYLEAEVVRTGQVHSTGANDLLDELDDDFPMPFQSVCDRCGNTFVTDLQARRSRTTGGVQLTCKAYCGCGRTAKERVQDSITVRTVAEIDDPDEFQKLLESGLERNVEGDS